MYSSFIFKEQVQWAVEGGADFMVCESIDNYGEAELALKAVTEFGKGEKIHKHIISTI